MGEQQTTTIASDDRAKKAFLVLIVIAVATTAALLIAFSGYLTPEVPPTEGDTTYEYDFVTTADDHEYINWSLSVGLGIYGSINVTAPANAEIVFFICDDPNYENWTKGYPHALHDLRVVDYYEFKFEIPYASLWHWIIFNNGSVTVDTHVNIAQDSTAPEIDINLVGGETYDGVYEITADISDSFDIEMVELHIDGLLAITQSGAYFSYSWDTTQWDNGEHQVKIAAFDSVGNSRSIEVTITIDN
ncbi:MAG: Ig-like domain-containing protein [Candidatus Thorarchaeota archaeon]